MTGAPGLADTITNPPPSLLNPTRMVEGENKPPPPLRYQATGWERGGFTLYGWV
jgi:hypothetical protein